MPNMDLVITFSISSFICRFSGLVPTGFLWAQKHGMELVLVPNPIQFMMTQQQLMNSKKIRGERCIPGMHCGRNGHHRPAALQQTEDQQKRPENFKSKATEFILQQGIHLKPLIL
ncbi:hypothetical protein SAY86_026138 [Trapa natans]|uniref:Uncharacterized protein n=1 Tax=Trapa natans TaxID=22666 RepID=A0AAN7QEQ8_TRANT|nr:hypothetical protein SAY86_026138 [Trapa natans]